MDTAIAVAPSALRRLFPGPARDELIDDGVVDAIRQGEPWAWERAYLAHARPLTGFLVVQLGNRDDAADALSETFARALRGCRGYRGGAGAFPVWLFRIARNVARDRARLRRRHTPGLYEADPEDASGVTPEAAAIVHEETALVREAVATLDPDDREVLLLRVCSRLSSEEVGRIVGKRPGAVRMQQHRALQALVARLESS